VFYYFCLRYLAFSNFLLLRKHFYPNKIGKSLSPHKRENEEKRLPLLKYSYNPRNFTYDFSLFDSLSQVNGEAEKKDDSGNETGADHEAEPDDAGGYDKTKSFFDNISCEAVERSKGRPQRPDWRQERKINSETFGYSTNRRGK
jgi:hypothetical protein